MIMVKYYYLQLKNSSRNKSDMLYYVEFKAITIKFFIENFDVRLR